MKAVFLDNLLRSEHRKAIQPKSPTWSGRRVQLIFRSLRQRLVASRSQSVTLQTCTRWAPIQKPPHSRIGRSRRKQTFSRRPLGFHGDKVSGENNARRYWKFYCLISHNYILTKELCESCMLFSVARAEWSGEREKEEQAGKQGCCSAGRVNGSVRACATEWVCECTGEAQNWRAESG